MNIWHLYKQMNQNSPLVNANNSSSLTTSSAKVTDDDDLHLQKLGYAPKLHRGLSAFSNFAVGFTEVAVLSSMCSVYGYGLSTGGPVVILWGFLVTYCMNMIVSLSMAEICSAYPSAGSVYHWSAQVVPAQYSPLCSYTCGWFNFLGNAAGDASFAYGWASMLNAAVTASGGEQYSSEATVGVSIIVIIIWSLLNCFRVDQLGWINNIAAFIQLSSVIFIVFALLCIPKTLNPSSFVFTHYQNETGFDNSSYVICIGILFSLFSFTGFEASAHMAEETTNAAVGAPLGIIYTCFATGLAGLFFIFALLYATTDIDGALNGSTNITAINVFVLASGHSCGAFMAWLVVINMFFSGLSSVTVTGRITFALMRDKGFYFADFFSEVHPTFMSPIRAIMFVCVFDILLQCVALTGNGLTAFYSITGLTTVGFQVSYAIPIVLKVLFDPADFPKTPMNLGKFSMPLGVLSSSWLLGTSLIMFLPTLSPVTTDNMNWLFLVFSVVFICGAVNWLFNSQYSFTGPKRNSTSTEYSEDDEQ